MSYLHIIQQLINRNEASSPEDFAFMKLDYNTFCFIYRTSLLVEDFVRQFPGRSLPVELAEFSFPTQLRETQNILLQPEKQVRL